VIDRLRIDVAANELGRGIAGRNQPDFHAFEIGTAFGGGLSGQGGRP
jgi:hypothetical protein